MTAYNRMYRCYGGQKPPIDTVLHKRTILLGKCEDCGFYFRLYPNGRVVMHKRKSRVSVS